jgi:hypothetical protein
MAGSGRHGERSCGIRHPYELADVDTSVIDALMLLYLLSAEELRDLLADMGYDLPPDAIVRTVDRYSATSTYGSTLSNVVHSWLEARRDRARSWTFLERALHSDLDDIQHGTTREGVHIGAMAGSVDIVTRCYIGLEMRSDRLWFHPLLPVEVDAVRFHLTYRDLALSVTVTRAELHIVSVEGHAAPVRIVVEGRSSRSAPARKGHSPFSARKPDRQPLEIEGTFVPDLVAPATNIGVWSPEHGLPRWTRRTSRWTTPGRSTCSWSPDLCAPGGSWGPTGCPTCRCCAEG